MLIVFLIFIVGMLALRIAGERKFRVNPEHIPTVERKPTALHESVQRLIGQIDTDEACIYYPLSDPHSALLSRLQLVERSTESLDVQYYVLQDDDAGRGLLANMLKAAKRGVKIRLLLDDIDIAGREALFASIVAEHENFEIRIFNPTYLRSMRPLEFCARFPRATRRMHNKSFTVDAAVTIVGGRNIGDRYFDVSEATVFADLDVLAAGEVVKGVEEQFNEYWYSGIAVDIRRIAKPANKTKYDDWTGNLETADIDVRAILAGTKEIVTLMLTPGATSPYCSGGDVIYDMPQKVTSSLMDTSYSVAPTIMDLFRDAQKDILISSPYFIPGNPGMELFTELRQRGVEITVLTNSFAANDVGAVHAGYMDYRKKLLEIGVKLFEFKSQKHKRKWSIFGSKRATLHAKTFVVDRKRNFVGSFNLDPRSAIHNTEMGIVFDCPAFGVRAFERLVDGPGASAYEVRLNDDGGLEWVDTAEDGTQTVLRTEPNTSMWQRVAIYLLSWLPVEWLM